MKIVAFRIDPELLRKARKKSKELGRTLSGQIRYLLKLFVDEKQ